ncbi:MAG: hypothetical protein AB1668_04605 [Nanoarchaeota archaeon]
MEKQRIERIRYEVVKNRGVDYGLLGRPTTNKPKVREPIPFGLIYHGCERRDFQVGYPFGQDYYAIFPVAESLFGDLLEHPKQIVKFEDYTFASLRRDFDPDDLDLEKAVALIYWGKVIRAEEEIDDYYKTEFVTRYGAHRDPEMIEDAKENVRRINRGEDLKYNRNVVIARNDHARGGECYYARPHDIVLEYWVEGGKMGMLRVRNKGYLLPEFNTPNPTPEGRMFLGKLLNAKVTIEERSMNEGMPDGLQIVTTAPFNVDPDAKRKRYRIEPLGE